MEKTIDWYKEYCRLVLENARLKERLSRTKTQEEELQALTIQLRTITDKLERMVNP